MYDVNIAFAYIVISSTFVCECRFAVASEDYLHDVDLSQLQPSRIGMPTHVTHSMFF